MTIHWKPVLLILLVSGLASVGPLIFPIAQAGYANLAILASHLLLPAILALAVVAGLTRNSEVQISRAIVCGALAGALATLPLEVIRLAGFHFGFMPGNLPRLMGVLLLDRFALGPSSASDVAGWGYHFWNGASLGMIYILLLGTRRLGIGILYGVAIGLGFMVSPVVISLGVGYFGLQFSYGFPATVLLAHLAFGAALAHFSRRFLGAHGSLILANLFGDSGTNRSNR